MNKKTKRFLSHECLRRAGRTFLQTACGVLFADMTAALTDWVQQIPGWKVGLMTLLASSVSAGIAAVMNLSCIAAPPEDEPE
ncbi:MAG: hypothetical protein MJ065_04560 [Oscillospiraceae bacterium]|nr:hypothetical protein [Oscillospiraceae bacterium]